LDLNRSEYQKEDQFFLTQIINLKNLELRKKMLFCVY